MSTSTLSAATQFEEASAERISGLTSRVPTEPAITLEADFVLATIMAYSGLQRQVLSFYRRALRIPRTKPAVVQSKFRTLLRYTFRTQAASVRARDVAAIEHLLRKGSRQLETWEDSGVRDCRISDVMKEWEHGQRIQLPPKSQSS